MTVEAVLIFIQDILGYTNPASVKPTFMKIYIYSCTQSEISYEKITLYTVARMTQILCLSLQGEKAVLFLLTDL